MPLVCDYDPDRIHCNLLPGPRSFPREPPPIITWTRPFQNRKNLSSVTSHDAERRSPPYSKMASPTGAMIVASRALRCLRAAGVQRNYAALSSRRDISFKLDEKTAHSSLDLFKKDTGVIFHIVGIDPSKVAQNLERFREWAVVLGDTPIESGRHYWEVTVKKSNEFRVGVADADMSRDECIGVSSRSWVFAYSHKKWNGMVVNKIIPITNIGHPSKVGLLVDYEGGKLCLVDPEKGSLIHTLNADFRGPIVPAFALWDGELLTHSGLDVPDIL